MHLALLGGGGVSGIYEPIGADATVASAAGVASGRVDNGASVF
jgi:hypothetical protein